MKQIELEDWLEDLRGIILDLNISINNAKYLLTDSAELENKIKKHGFFQHHTYQLKFITVIQLSKIFEDNDNQKRNVLKLFNKIENERLDRGLLNLLAENKGKFNRFDTKEQILKAINILRNEIETYSKIIDNIKKARDTIYAHKDPNKKILYIKWTDLEQLVNLSSRIYNEFNSGFYGAHMEFCMTMDWNVKDIIKNLAMYKEIFKKKQDYP
jgi:mannose/fructose/N-acetylgalactosamine-specific phosphotransferase system component IIB